MTQTGARGFVSVGRADAALGGAELLVALELLAPFVDARVVRHDEVRAVADEQIFIHGDVERAAGRRFP